MATPDQPGQRTAVIADAAFVAMLKANIERVDREPSERVTAEEFLERHPL